MKARLQRLTARLLAKFNRTQIFLIMLCQAGVTVLLFIQVLLDQIRIFMGAKQFALMYVTLALWAVSYLSGAFVFNEFKRRYPLPRESADE